MALTPKQERFVAEYLVDLNATAAAKRAGYSEKTSYSMGQRLLKKVETQEAIQVAVAKRERRTEVTQDYVISKLKEIADKEAADYQDSPMKYTSKLRALEMLGKHLGLFEARGSSPQRENEDDPLSASLKEWMKDHGN